MCKRSEYLTIGVEEYFDSEDQLVGDGIAAVRVADPDRKEAFRRAVEDPVAGKGRPLIQVGRMVNGREVRSLVCPDRIEEDRQPGEPVISEMLTLFNV